MCACPQLFFEVFLIEFNGQLPKLAVVRCQGAQQDATRFCASLRTCGAHEILLRRAVVDADIDRYMRHRRIAHEGVDRVVDAVSNETPDRVFECEAQVICSEVLVGRGLLGQAFIFEP